MNHENWPKVLTTCKQVDSVIITTELSNIYKICVFHFHKTMTLQHQSVVSCDDVYNCQFSRNKVLF